jgi:hypothetical protein
MVLSMLAVGGVVFFGYLFIPHSGGDGVHVVEYRAALASAKRAAPYPLLGPEGLSDRWRATSVDYRKDNQGHAVWHLGFITPSGQYAAIEQSNASRDDVIAAAVAGGKSDGSASVAGQDWQRYQGSRYRGLASSTGAATTVVTGTASYQELAQLAQSLR